MNIQNRLQKRMIERTTEERWRNLQRRMKCREYAAVAGCVSILAIMVALVALAIIAMCRADAELAESETRLAARQNAVEIVRAGGAQ